MLSKLLSLLVAGKGGAIAAAAIVASATTVNVLTTSTDLQDGMNNVVSAVQQVIGVSRSVDEDTDLDEDGDHKVRSDCEHGQPVVVAQRNAADKLLRAAYQDEHLRLEHARGGGKDVDHQKVNEILQKADRDLRGVLTTALNDVARNTLGREGQIKPSGTPAATPTFTVTPSPTPTFVAPTDGSPTATPKPTCSPRFSATPTGTPGTTPTPTPTATPTATATATSTATVHGREEVASRVTLDAALQAIVDKAKADMKAIVDTALADIAALPTPSPKPTDHGKPAGTAAPHGPEKSDEHGKSDDHKSSPPRPSFSPPRGRP